MQNVSSDTSNNNETIDKGSTLQELGKVSTPHSFNSSPIKSEFNPSYAEIYLSDTSDSEDDDVSEVEAFVMDQDDEADMEEKYYLPSEEDAEDTVDPETQARLEALLKAAGIGNLALASVDKKIADPEVLRRLTSSVSCALDEAAAALTRMRNENPRPQNERSLVQACSDGDVKTVKKLLTEGRSVHETTDEGESLLSLACSAGYYELAQVLLAMHANVEDRGIKGECTPLMEAASSGFIEIVRLLVNHGADVNGQSSSGNTPLMYACAGGHQAVVRVLLECGANVEDHNENGHTPLMEAASAGHVGVASILLEYGAGINTHSNEFKESALTLACYKGHLDMVRFLLACGADQEHKTDEMHTALMEASMDGHVEVAKLLLDSGAQVNMPTDSFESPLTLAACGGHVDLALLLIERGANIEEVNDEGYTPLMEAAREGHEEMVCVLLEKGAKINAHTEETQETALTLACCGGFLDVADFLLKNGANIELGASTPLMEAAQEGHLELVRYLLDAGAQVHAKTQTGDTALTYACENGHTDVADLLLSYGANLEHESEGGRTPLMKACRAGHLCTVQFLISKNADVNRQTSNNDHTPLSLACAGGHLNVVQLLLAHNADPYHKLKDNSTMLIEAAKGGHTNVVQLLLDFPRSVLNGSASSPSEESAPHVCNQGELCQQSDEIVNQVFEPKEQTAASVTASLPTSTTTANVTPSPANVTAVASSTNPPNVAHVKTTQSPAITAPPANASGNSASSLGNPVSTVDPLVSASNVNADKVREKLHSLNLQQLKLLQKEKLQLQELQTKHIDILEFKKKKQEELASGKAASLAAVPNTTVANRKDAKPSGEKANAAAASNGGGDSGKVPALCAKTKQKMKALTDQNKVIDYLKCLNVQKAQQLAKYREEMSSAEGHRNTKSSQTKSQSTSSQKSQPLKSSAETSQASGELTLSKSKAPSRVPCPTPVANATPTVANATPTVANATPTVANATPTVANASSSLLNPINASGIAVPTPTSASSAVPTTSVPASTPIVCTNPTNASVCAVCPNLVGSMPPLGGTMPPHLAALANSLPVDTRPAIYDPNDSVLPLLLKQQTEQQNATRPVVPVKSSPDAAGANMFTPAAGDVPLRAKTRKILQNICKMKKSSAVSETGSQVMGEPQPPSLTNAEVQQVTNAPQVLGLGALDMSEAEINFLLQDPKCHSLLQDPKCQGPLANFFQSQFFIDHLKRMKVDQSATRSGDAPASPSPPGTPPNPGEPHRPVTPPLPPLNYFGVDPNTSPPRAGASQGVVVGTQPLFHPGANTTVLHNTIYARSSAPVPSPADVNQSTAIADRPKAKPASKKEGKNAKKHQLAAFHLAMQQQKEALQLKQLVEMNEQLVVSQQKQLVLNHSATGTDTTTRPDSPLLSNDILADSMARSKLLASTAKEMMESMSVKVDMDQETRDLIDQLESITMEEVERAASEGQKKLLQNKLLNKHYVEGLQDGLKALAANPEANRFQPVAPGVLEQVDFVNARHPIEGYGKDCLDYFAMASPGVPIQVQEFSNGFQVQYQVSRQEISQFAKADGKASPFSSPTMSPKNDCDCEPSPPPTDVCLTPTPTQVVATQTSPEAESAVPPVPPAVDAAPCVKKATSEAGPSAQAWAKGKKRQARHPVGQHSSGCPTNPANVDPNHSRFPGSSTDSSSAAPGGNPSYSGMDVDSETESNHDTALTLACAGGHEELVELLLSRGADIEHRDKKGFTPLILAATAGHDKVVEILLNHVADMEAQSERTKDTPLSLACSGGRYEVVELLLTRGANKEHRNVSDYTPLSLAASGGYVNIIKLLLTHGAEINSRTGSKLGISPLMLAAMNGHTAAVKLLLDMGSDINAQIETNRNTALTLACFQGRHEVVSLLLDRKANVEHRAKTGLTPLMEAASGGYVEVGRVLLDKGADVNAPPVPSSRDTALTIAADKGHCRFVELLLSKGAQVEVKNKKGNSPLWLAANGGHLSVVELLCKHKADIDSQDNRKVSCLMAAFRKGHVKAVRWMVNHVNQFPSDQEMTRYIQTVNDKELLDKCQECSMVIRVAKNQQAERANKNANILLEELDMEKWREESKKAAQARKRERKKQKKLEKKEQKKAREEEEEDEDEEELDDDENDLETSTGRGEGEEGDSGIDANSQASSSSNEVKSATPTTKTKSKKKKKASAPTPVTSVKASVAKVATGATNSKEVKEKKSMVVVKETKKVASVDTSGSKKEKKKQQQPVAQQANASTTQQASASTTQQPSSKPSSQYASKETKKPKSVPQPAAVEKEEIATLPVLNGSDSPPSKEKKTKAKIVTTPRKEPQQLIFESTRHPAEREDFEATGSDIKVSKQHASLMSLYSDGELVASSSGGKILTKQQVGKREEGWKEVVRKYLNTTFRHKKVSVPLNAISRVIGRGGSNINAIRSATSAHIEVEKQCKGQGERIITIKGNNEAIKQAHALINSLIKDPDVDLVKLLADTAAPIVTPSVAPAPSKTKPVPAITNTAAATGSAAAKVNPPASNSQIPASTAAPPPLLGSLTFVKAPVPPVTLPTPQAASSAPTPLIPGLRASAPRPLAPRIVAPAATEKTRAPAPARATPAPSASAASTASSLPLPPISSSLTLPPTASSLPLATPITPSPSPQPRPLPTASAPPAMSAPVETTPPPPTQPTGLTEYSLFNDTFTKVTQQSVWGREDEDASAKQNGGMNFASVAATASSVANSEPPCPSPSPPDVANLAKAPGYRGTTSVSSPVLCRMSTSASPLYQQPRASSMYIEDTAPLYQQDLLKMVPAAPGASVSSYMPQTTTSFIPQTSTTYMAQTSTSFLPQTTTVNYMSQSSMSNMAAFLPQSTTVSMSRLNPRAPDFSSVKPQPQAPLFNASIPPPVLPTLTRWPGNVNYPMNYSNDMMSQLLAMENFTGLEMTPPTSPPHAMDERKVQPRPIGTERAWKNYNQEKTLSGIGDNRHMFRSSMPQYSQDLAPPLPPLDNYTEAQAQPLNYNLNVNGVGATTLMLLPQQQTFAGLSSLLPAATADNSWCEGQPQPADWTKWTN